jgi:hypothetical protein
MKINFLKSLMAVSAFVMMMCACSLPAQDLALGDEAILVEAENFDAQHGIGQQPCDDGTQQIAWIESGDYAGYSGINLTGKNMFEARVAGASNGSRIEIRLGSSLGTLIGSCEVPDTSGFHVWRTISCPIEAQSGVHDVYLVFEGGEGFLFNVNWFKFENKVSFIKPSLIEAEYFSQQSGIVIAGNGEGTDKISDIHDGDWVLFKNVDFGAGMVRFEARITSGWSGGWIEVRLDGPTGELLGECLVVTTDGWDNWKTRYCSITETSGIQDIYLTFRKDVADADKLFDINWIRFTDEPFTRTGNPIIEHLRTADPSVHIWEHLDDGKFWMYASHDMNDATGYESMDGYHVFSSTDLENWTDHGEVLHSRDVSWGLADGGWMWAPDCAYKNGTYYFYFPHKDASGAFRTGVATSDRPEGPFTDTGHYIEGTSGTDPACFIDDDGQAYLYFGSRKVAKLKENMIELAESPRDVDYGADNFGEGAWMHKRNGIYYYSYTDYTARDFQAYYSMGDSPYGPFEYKGPVNKNPVGAQNHHSILEYDGQWYYFYHVGGAGPNPWQRRMVCVDYLYYNSDGTMQLLKMTDEGVDILEDRSGFSVWPEEYPAALRNPLKGFRPETYSSNFGHEYGTITRCYIKWNEIENDESDTIQKIKDFCDQKWEGVVENGITVIPRVYLDWDSKPGNQYWPADMTTGDYSSEQFKQRLVRLISRLGECWDNDPRVAWVQLGIIGKWGEHHSPSPTAEIQTLMGDAITAAFKNKKVLVRHPDEFNAYDVGVYWDSWAHIQQVNGTSQGLGIERSNKLTGRWKTQPIEGEVAYDWGDFRIQPGDDPDDTLADPIHRDFLIDTIRNLHCTGLGWVADYDQTNPDVQAGADAVQQAFGYRFVITKFRAPRRVEAGADLNFYFLLRNTGSAPFYYDWPVEFSLLDPETRLPVWKTRLDGVDIREWLPGDDWDEARNFYTSPPKLYKIEQSIPLPGQARLPKGEYIAALSILEPVGGQPSVRFAINNYFNDGRHPFGRIGVGVDVDGGHTVDPVTFNEPQ